jgi:uncharacterized MAPEG superfamily protein
LFASGPTLTRIADGAARRAIRGAQLFFYSRLGHAIIYLKGRPYVRPLFWLGGVAGTAMVLASLFN